MHSEVLLRICSQIDNMYIYVCFYNSNTKENSFDIKMTFKMILSINML